jgi:hypothetical protein
MTDPSKSDLPRKLRYLVDQFEIAKRKTDVGRIAAARQAIVAWARNQKDVKLKAKAMELADMGEPPPQDSRKRDRSPGPGRGRPFKPVARSTQRSNKPAKASVLGLPFHNPYTYIDFRKEAPPRRQPSLLTKDEEDADRLTGFVDLDVVTSTPLVTLNPVPVHKESVGPKEQGKFHKTYEALRIGPDVIYPATGVRGCLRALLRILTGGTLNLLDSSAYFCETRNVHLGPGPKGSEGKIPTRQFLARVIQAGNAMRDGIVECGETLLLPIGEIAIAVAGKRDALPQAPRSKKDRTLLRAWSREVNEILGKYQPTAQRPKEKLYLRANGDGWQTCEPSDPDAYELRLSGRPVNMFGKKEGLFRNNGLRLTLPATLWAEFHHRHRHGMTQGELRAEDLIWLELTDPTLEDISTPDQVKSLQWSRWGRLGEPYTELVPKHVRPDAMRKDGLVDLVTDLFGQVGLTKEATSFASRIRPENLVFKDLADPSKLAKETLAPLMTPHGSCTAFSRYQSALEVDPEATQSGDRFRGYKVYRVQSVGKPDPWKWTEQGIWNAHDAGKLEPKKHHTNKTVELVPVDQKATLRIAFRALSRYELACLLYACEQPWRLGGGKPFGLGLCTPSIATVKDEHGHEIVRPVGGRLFSAEGSLLDASSRLAGFEQNDDCVGLWAKICSRAEIWRQSQVPVEFVRYPRATERVGSRIGRGGHLWFQRHAARRLSGPSARPGLQVLAVSGALAERAKKEAGGNEEVREIAPQPLPSFDPKDVGADVLFGYDGLGIRDEEAGFNRVLKDFEEFQASRSVTGKDRSSGSHSSSRHTRKQDRNKRS